MVVTTPISEDYMYAVATFIKSHKSLMDACEHKQYDKIPRLSSKLERAKNALLDEKERQGYDDGLSFLENNSFAGFRIQNGRFIGDDVSAYKLGCEFAAGFRNGTHENIYYEVALFILYNVDVEKARDVLHGDNSKQIRSRAA